MRCGLPDSTQYLLSSACKHACSLHTTNMKYIFYLPLFLLSARFAAAQYATAQVAIIKAERAASNTAIAKHDVEGIAKYWMPDFVQVRGNATHMTGKDAIKKSWSDLFTSNPEVSYIRNPSEIIISKNDTLAWEKGKWIGIKSYSKGGNYSAMWRKINNEWKIQAEIFVSLY